MFWNIVLGCYYKQHLGMIPMQFLFHYTLHLNDNLNFMKKMKLFPEFCLVWNWDYYTLRRRQPNSSEPAAVGGSGFQFLPLKKSGVDWNRYENHPISQLKNYAYLDENMPYPIQPISHYAAAYKFTIHTFYLAVAQDRHKPPGESGHVSLFTRSYACAALKISWRPLLS